MPKFGPWGGGAKTVNRLWEVLENRGHKVVPQLEDDIDVILCIDPRPNERGEWYQTFLDYRDKNPKTKIVQRVGDVGTHSKPQLTELVKRTLGLSDYFIFTSKWAKEWIGFKGDNCIIINNAPMKVFYKNRNTETTLPENVSVVTHHWSTNPKKGFDIYQKFENWCESNNIDFHYVGQVPPGTMFKNYQEPMSSEDLSSVLPKHHIYLTASEQEAGANHVLEAAAAGLPIIYRNTGGSIVDYCQSMGEVYSNFEELVEKTNLMIKEYGKYKSKVLSYSDNNHMVVDRYCNIVENI